jgi:hypothetical protein
MHSSFQPQSSIRGAYYLAVAWVLLLAVYAIGPRAAHAAIPAGLPDTTPPTVLATDPTNGAINVTVDKKISATFSEAMDPATITTATTFTLQPQGGTLVSGTVAYSSVTATLHPTAPLVENTIYIATITTGARDTSGTALVAPRIWHFTTVQDATIPSVVSTSPIDSATSVSTNRRIFVVFSKAMNAATLTPATFTLEQGGGFFPPGIVTCVGNTASFVPTGDLSSNSTCTATITLGAKDLAGHSLASPSVWTFSTGSGLDLVRPRVLTTVPAAEATGVPIDQAIVATFDDEMDPFTINAATFTLRQTLGSILVAGSVTSTSRTAVLRPTVSLAPNTSYTATLTTAVEDVSGNSLVPNSAWTFRTASATPPTVVATDPANLATGVSVDKTVTVTFSEAMDAATVTTATFTLKQGATPVRATVRTSSATATLVPASALAPNTTYTATVTTGVRGVGGDPLAGDFVWRFVTGSNIPTVVSTNPANGATGVPIDQKITATFSRSMDRATITSATFTLKQGTTAVRGTVSYASATQTATFAPLTLLLPDTVYSAAITVGAKDVAGNPLASEHAWTFTSGHLPPNQSQATVIVFKHCDIAPPAAGDFSLTVTHADPYATIKITVAVVSGAQAAPKSVPHGGTIVLLNCTSIPSVTVQGSLAVFSTQVPVDALTVSGSIGRIMTARSSVGIITAHTLSNVFESGAADAFGVMGASGTSATYAATSIYTGGNRNTEMSVSLSGVVLEDLVTSQTLKSVSVSSRLVPKKLTGGVKGVVSVGGIGRVIPTGASGSVATDFRLQAQGITKVKASGASILPDTLDSTRNNLLQLTAQSQTFAGHTIGGLVGDTGDGLHVTAPNMGTIRGDKGVHGEFVAGTSSANARGLILQIATKSQSGATTRTTPISGDAFVGVNTIIFLPDHGTMTVHTNGRTTGTLGLAPDPEPVALGLRERN